VTLKPPENDLDFDLDMWYSCANSSSNVLYSGSSWTNRT